MEEPETEKDSGNFVSAPVTKPSSTHLHTVNTDTSFHLESNIAQDSWKDNVLETELDNYHAKKIRGDVEEDKNQDINSSGGAKAGKVKVKEDEDSDGNSEKDPELFVTFEKLQEANVCTQKKGEFVGVIKGEATEFSSVCREGELSEVNTRPVVVSEAETQTERNEGETFQQDVKVVVSKFSEAIVKNKSAPNCLRAETIKHPLLPPCQCNKRRCAEQFSYEIRSLLHEKFWTMNMYDRREWINEYLFYLKPKSRTNNPVSSLHQSHRKFYLPNLSGKIEVCRKMFFSTLGFKDEAKFLKVPTFLNKKGMLSRTRKRKCIMSRKDLQAVDEYCKELTAHHGNAEVSSTSNLQTIIPPGFSLRDMYNDFCTKKSISFFGYHRFRQIVELILRGERVEDSQFAELKDDEENDNDEDNCINKDKKRRMSPPDQSMADAKKDGHEKKRKETLSKKKKKKKQTLLKLSMFGEIKTNPVGRTKKARKTLLNNSVNERYNFRASKSAVRSYCEDNLVVDSIDSEIESESFDVVKDEQNIGHEKELLDPKQTSSKSVRETSNTKIKKCYGSLKKSEVRKKRKKAVLRDARIKFVDSRKKSGTNHPVLPPCKCNARKCYEKILDKQRWVIHNDFWILTDKLDRKKWIQRYITHCRPRSRSNFIKFPRKHLSKKYYFPAEDGKLINVCRMFFMRTLGYYSNMTIESVEMNSGTFELSNEIRKHVDSYEKTLSRSNDPCSSADGSKHFDIGEKSEEEPCLIINHSDLKELNEETGNIQEPTIHQDDSLGDKLNEHRNRHESLFDPKNAEKGKCVFFTPEIEKKEVEKAVDPAFRRRRPLSLRNSKEHHPMREPCHCSKKKCREKILQDRREAIHEHYWSLITYNQRKQWILDHIKREVPKRRTVLSGPVRKKESRKCYLPEWDGNKVEVCREFFLSTLGFKWDKMIDTICKTTPQDSKYVRADQRGRKAPVHKIPDKVIHCMREYLESILQTIPFVQPQPQDPISGSKKKKKKKKTSAPAQSCFTIKTLYADYKAKHPNQKVSYATFRRIHCEVRDQFKSQDPVFEEREDNNINSAASPESDHDIGFDEDNDNDNPPYPTGMVCNSNNNPSLQSCMFNDQPQLLNLSPLDNTISKNTGYNEPVSGQGPGEVKFSKAQDPHHLLPFSSTPYNKAVVKGHTTMYPIPNHSNTNVLPQYSSSQNNHLDPFYMAAPSQNVTNSSIAYSNLHFPSNLINHPHLHTRHPHIYPSAIPYLEHSRFSTPILPQTLKEHNHNQNHHFYTNPSTSMDFGQNHHHHHHHHQHAGQESVFSTLPFPSFTTSDNVNHSPTPNQIPSQLSFSTSDVINDTNDIVNSHEQRSIGNSNNNDLPVVSRFVENSKSSKASENEKIESLTRGIPEHFNEEKVINEKKIRNVKKSNKKCKKDEEMIKVKKERKVRPLSNRNSKEHHPMLPPCACSKKCLEKVPQEQRERVYDIFWDVGCYNNRKQWIAEHMTREDPKRRTNLEATVIRKKETRRFNLPNSSDKMVDVCRQFFLHTLGLKWDKIIGTICKTTGRDEMTVPPDMRGKKAPAHKLDEEVSRSVESYTTALLQAAKPEYLAHLQQPDGSKKLTIETFIPYGITMKHLHHDYKTKHASHKVSYESFRKIFRQVRQAVLDPNSVVVEETDDCIGTDSVGSEGIQGTINAATGHIDTA